MKIQLQILPHQTNAVDIVNEVESYNISGNLKEINPYKVQTLYDTMSRHFRFEEDLLY